MLRTGQRTADDDPGFRQWLFHVRANRRDNTKSRAVIHNDHGKTVYIELLDRILGDFTGVANFCPAHFRSFLSTRRFISANEILYRVGDFPAGLRD